MNEENQENAEGAAEEAPATEGEAVDGEEASAETPGDGA